ncbi:hypothetical protein [Enterococcus timonensis]|uniref:hypothetical protein n=1 Tax=Enterococcus timonensis TaxID=1852364 RepID=UPI0008DA77BC|nr:hypothetical protein [Enterococcus timonensis]
MPEENTSALFKNGLAFGLGLGAVIGSYSAWLLKAQAKKAPEEILAKVKNAFLKEGPITGSWIESTKKKVRKFAITQEIYQGGIHRVEDGQNIQYAFTADANTGSIVEIHRI